MKKYYVFLKTFFIIFLIIFQFENISAKKVICVDNGTPENDDNKGYMSMKEGWERQTSMPGDTVMIGGNLTDCLKLVRDGDSLVIVAHGSGQGKFFVWNNVAYSGFGAGAGKYPVPGGFDTLRNVKAKFCSCFSMKDPDGGGPDKPLTDKLKEAMGGAARGNTAVGFLGLAYPKYKYSYQFYAPLTKEQIRSEISSCIADWCKCPPVNRPYIAPGLRQDSCLQRALDVRFGNGKVIKIKIEYEPPKDSICPPLINDDTCQCCNDTICGSPVSEEGNACAFCSITGPLNVLVNSISLYIGSTPEWFFTISNFPPCNASITGSNTGDSVLIDAGLNPGIFNLYFKSRDTLCGDTLCAIQITVDNPLPVELTSFTSNISGRNVNLIWTTSREENNSGFEIQRADATNNSMPVWNIAGFIEGRGSANANAEYYFADRNLHSGRFNYRLKQIDYNGNFKFYDLKGEVNVGIPGIFSLHQNYPNPFNPVTKINYDLSADGNVRLTIFNNNGREVKTLVNEFQKAGYYTKEFSISGDGNNFASGVYFYRIETGLYTASMKMVIIK